jgi:hypothetical protein
MRNKLRFIWGLFFTYMILSLYAILRLKIRVTEFGKENRISRNKEHGVTPS